MRFTLKQPCDDCPFLKEGGVRISRARAREIGNAMISSAGSTFACHKTTQDSFDDDGEYSHQSSEQHCYGALVFAERNHNATQLMRIAERLGSYNAQQVIENKAARERIVATVGEFVGLQPRWAG